MTNSVSPGEAALPTPETGWPSRFDWLASFRFTYVAIFVFILLYVFTVKGAEALLEAHFQSAVTRAVRGGIEVASGIQGIQERVDRVVRRSAWVRLGGVRVTAIVLGTDGRTLYVGGDQVSVQLPPDPLAGTELEDLLPVTAQTVTSVPHGAILTNGILLFYAALLVQLLYVRSRSLARREQDRLRMALESRDTTARRAETIGSELSAIREKLRAVEPELESHRKEVGDLEREREELQQKLETLAQREAGLRQSSQEARSLDEERQALEELLDEAVRDLSQKDAELKALDRKLKKAARSASSGGRTRETEQLARRLRTLYKNIEIDDHAIQNLVALRDEAMKLKAEENLKRLSDEADNTAVRRKVGGLPPHLSIFELGFAGKGRIYYTRGRQRRFRVLLVGAKNTQKTDLEYLSRLPRTA